MRGSACSSCSKGCQNECDWKEHVEEVEGVELRLNDCFGVDDCSCPSPEGPSYSRYAAYQQCLGKKVIYNLDWSEARLKQSQTIDSHKKGEGIPSEEHSA